MDVISPSTIDMKLQCKTVGFVQTIEDVRDEIMQWYWRTIEANGVGDASDAR